MWNLWFVKVYGYIVKQENVENLALIWCNFCNELWLKWQCKWLVEKNKRRRRNGQAKFNSGFCHLWWFLGIVRMVGLMVGKVVGVVWVLNYEFRKKKKMVVKNCCLLTLCCLIAFLCGYSLAALTSLKPIRILFELWIMRSPEIRFYIVLDASKIFAMGMNQHPHQHRCILAPYSNFWLGTYA